MSEDLYAMLGVSKDASQQEIKSAYRKVARKYHPDINKEAGAEDKFKKIQKAYSVLSDTDRKQRYDQFGVADDSAAGNQGGFGGFSGFEGFSSNFEGGFEDIFDTFFGGSGRSSSRSSGIAGEDLRFDMTISLEDAANGIEEDLEIYHLETDPNSQKKCGKCNGTGSIKIIQRTMLGSIQQVTTCPQCQGTGGVERKKKKKKINVKVPAGVETGNKLRVSGEGNQGVNGGQNGDLYVFITVKDHKYFEREENHIILNLNLPFTQLILGCSIEVPVLNGAATLKIPSGTQPGTTFRLKGKGIPNLQGYGRGDQYVKVSAQLPKHLNSKEKDLIKQMEQMRGEDKVRESVEEFIVK
ncbi:molecular chaperone DnaJ [Candidatus Marinamargulisbacteria bacterium SCGC AG-343-D04]|nr:molecular chaperone DnaJ [Candidatus Marinamargulisbacteria bacterium SCGC AG-343-D04]